MKIHRREEAPVHHVGTPTVRGAMSRSDVARLLPGQVRSIHLSIGECCYLVAHSGTGWVTMEGDTIDHVLAPSGVLNFFGPGRLVIEAIGNEILEFVTRISNHP